MNDSVEPGFRDCVAEAEIPYDGVDQDCDGADLTDVDGDGHAGIGAGGDDCDDESATTHRGADEVPYDGVDQDCDGADFVDVDGDGFVAEEAGGDDCDDTDAAVHPGADESSKTNGRDDDCDGYTDETDVCPDGTGDFLTIQEGVDGTSDGGTVLLCAASYVENVVITARELSIVGGGSLPDDVEWHSAQGWTLYAEGSDVTARWLTISSAEVTTVCGAEGSSIHIDYVLFPTRSWVWGFDSLDRRTDVSVSNSRFVHEGYIYIDGADGRVSVAQTVFEGDAYVGADGASPYEGLLSRQLVVRNSVFVGDDVEVALNHVDTAGSMTLENNTFAGVSSLLIDLTCGDSRARLSECAASAMSKNIFDAVRGAYLYEVGWYGGRYSMDDADTVAAEAAPTFDSNVLWELEVESLYALTYVPYCTGDEYSCSWEYPGWWDTAYSSEMSAASVNEDPLFVEGESGSYTLDPESPARHVDAGAFGGTHADWWREYPWPLP